MEIRSAVLDMLYTTGGYGQAKRHIFQLRCESAYKLTIVTGF